MKLKWKKRGVLLLAATFLLGCSQTKVEETPKKVRQEKSIPKINLSTENIELKEYHNFKKGDLYENPVIIYSKNDRDGYIVGAGIRAKLKKEKDIDSKLLNDEQINKEVLISNNLILIGNTNENRVLKEMKKQLPIDANGEKISINNEEFTEEKMGVTYLYPNLYNQNKNMVLILGNSGSGYKYVDFKNGDINLHMGIDQVVPVFYREKGFTNFTKNWEVKELKKVDPARLKTGENKELEVGEIKDYPFPEWAKGKIIYQIFPRSFYDTNGDGIGDLNGITKKLDYLKDLGVDILWLTPIFESPSYHGYDISNYFKIAKEYGDIEDFRNLAQEMHKRDMYLMLDLVLNHTSSQQKYFKDAYNNPDSKYDRWFYFSNIQNTIYHDWYFKSNPDRRNSINSRMLAWNTNNEEVVNFHRDIAKYWLDPNEDGDNTDGADGFRLDYVKGPSHNYWKLFRQKIKEVNSDTLLLGEAWVDLEKMKPYFDNELDILFDFALQGSMTTGILTDVKNTLIQQKSFPENARFARFMSNHDLDRFPTYIPVPRVKVYSSLIFTLPGLPTLYYGDELGVKGDKADGDQGVRAPMEWTADNTGEGIPTWTSFYSKTADGISVEEQKNDPDSILNHTKKLIKIRKENLDIFKTKDINLLDVYTGKGSEKRKARRVIAYYLENKGKEMLVILNFGKKGKYNIDFPENKEYNIILEANNEVQGTLELNKGENEIELEKFSTNIY
ncbi:MAG: alpha-amylase family glycosyl hydrolase, partial [Fusobacteriota bacterium]